MLLRFVRRCLMTLGVLSLLPIAAAVVTYLWRGGGLPQDSVLQLTLDGAIPEAPSSSVTALWREDGTLHLAEMVHRLRAAADDKRVVGLLLEVKDPKVGLAQLAELRRAVQAFRASGKWTAAYVETVGEGGHGDGAYALAAMAQNIYLSPPGEVHLSGMHAEVPFLAETFDRAKLDVHVQQRYEYKNFADTFVQKGFTEAHHASVKSLLDDMQATLSGHIAEARNQSPNVVAEWVQAAPFHAGAAKARGLVDKVLYWDEVQALVDERAGRDDALVELADYTPPSRKKKQVDVAYVVGEGEISRGAGGGLHGEEGMSSETYVQALQQARQDKVRGVLLRIDSPGGSYLASDLIRREVARTRADKIPVVVSMGNTAASGGYFIAAEADHIVAEAGTVTGSIGVVGASFAVGRALEHFFGVHFGRYDALPHPGTLDLLAPPDALQRARLSEQIDRVYNDFVGKVAQGRHKSFAEVHAVAKGRVWTGQQALALGLVDTLGGIDEAKAYLARRIDLQEGEELALQLYPAPKSPLELVRDTLDVTVGAVPAVRSLHALRAPLRTLTGWLGAARGEGAQARMVSTAPIAP